MTMTLETPTAPTRTWRSPAPDLARGFMLLAIAFAHAPMFLTSSGITVLDNIAEFINTVFVSNQARPMFVFLFGYGLTQLVMSRRRRGSDDLSIRKLLRRRGFWLIVIGLAHATLLVPLDILASYGITSVLFAAMVNAKTKTLLWTASGAFLPCWAMSAAPVLLGLFNGTTADGGTQLELTGDLAMKTLLGVQNWAFATLTGPLFVIPGMLLGILAARHGLLDEPRRHISLLRRLGWGGLAVAVVGKLPAALILSDVWEASAGVKIAAGVTQPLVGYIGGIAMAALVGVLAVRIGDNHGRFALAVSALGQRSMTFYLFQSVVFLALFYPFTLGLSGMGGMTAALLVAVGTWLVSLILADILRRNGKPGPADALLRRVTRRHEPSRTSETARM